MPTSVRRPRLQVNVNGISLPALSAQVTNRSHFSADTFRVAVSINALPVTMPLAFWSATEYTELEILCTIDDGLPFSLIYGQLDDVDVDLVGGVMTLSGRDLSGQLIDTRTDQKYQNLTSSQIAQQIALSVGLSSDVTATTTPVGTYYEIDHARIAREQSEWDLLVYLAKHECFDVWVSGTTLYFQPSPQPTAIPYLLTFIPGTPPSANFERITMKRAITLAKDVVVRVRSWHQAQEKSFDVTWPPNKNIHAGYKKAQLYSFTFPNLTKDQALQKAKWLAEDITRHERVIDVVLPGDNILSTRTMVQLTGTGTQWDQSYYPDTIERSISFEQGYRMTLTAKNHSPQSTEVV